MNEQRYRAAEARLWNSYDLTPTEERLRATRSGTWVRAQVVGDGPLVLFVHGASSSGANWAPLVAQLRDHRCVLLDRPGCGLSEPPAGPFTSVEQLASFADGLVVDVVDALGEGSVKLVTTSMGGYFGIRGAVAYPARIERLVHLASTIGAPMEKLPLVMRLAGRRPVARLMTSVPPTRGAVRAILRQIGLGDALATGRVSDEFLDWFHSLLRDTATLRNEIDSTGRVLPSGGGINADVEFTDEFLAGITTPAMFLWGEDDPMGGADVARRFVSRIPGAQLELLAGCGHAPWVDRPAHCADAVRAFFA